MPHSPGPWKANLFAATGNELCDDPGLRGGDITDWDVTDAAADVVCRPSRQEDVRLIAAAPELAATVRTLAAVIRMLIGDPSPAGLVAHLYGVLEAEALLKRIDEGKPSG